MKLNKEQAIAKVQDTIKGERHQDYKRTVDLAIKYKRLNTGEDIDSMLEQYNPRESNEAFEQRKRITKVTTSALASSVRKPFLKVPRTDRVVRKIIPRNKRTDKAIESEIQTKLDLFFGSDSEEGGLDFWLRNRFVELSFSDPNTFIVIEFNDFDHLQETPNAYPFEVPSEDALNFHVDNNNVHWLVARQRIKYKAEIEGDGFKFEDGERFTIYCGEFSIVFRRISKNKAVQLKDVQDHEEIIQVENESFYAVSEYQTKLPDWQLFRVGYVRDEHTDGRTFVNPYHSALPYFEKSIKAVSEMDLTNTLHVFPQKLQYVTNCLGEPENTCNKGRNREGGICKACNGRGTQFHTSSQDVITYPLPDTKEELFPLRDMMVYFTPPIELLDFQYKVINDFDAKIHQAVFNSTVLVQKTVVATATEKDQDMDSVYDTLTPFAQKCSAVYLNVCNAIAVLMGYESRVSFVYRFPNDFKIKTKQMLYNEMKTISETSAPSFVREAVQDDFANQVFIDDPEGLIKYKVKKQFQPFRGKSEEEIILALNSQFTLNRSKILYLNFEEIFSEAEQKDQNFYIHNYQVQKAVIDEIIAEYEKSLTPVAPTFNPISTEETE